MKRLSVLTRAELEIPDDWNFVQHPSGIRVLKIGDAFVDFDIAPLSTESKDPDAAWTDRNIGLVSRVLDAVTGLDTELELAYQQ